MINQDKLLDIAENVQIYAEPETISIKEPRGDIRLREWMEKVGDWELPPAYVCELKDIDLCGPIMVGIHKQDVVLDVGYYGRIDLWERNKPYYDIALQAKKLKPYEVDVAMSLTGVWSDNYFHWTLDHLPTLEALEKHYDKNVKLIARRDSFIYESIKDMGYTIIDIREHPHILAHKLIVPINRRRKGIIYKSAVQWLQRQVSHTKLTSKKIYISRRRAQSRRVVNEEELTDTLLQRGFSVILMEMLSVNEQRGIMRNAEVVISPHGAGLSNIAYSVHPFVQEFVHPEYTNPCIWLITEVMGWDHRYIVGKPDIRGKEFMEIDIEKVMKSGAA